MENKDYVIIVAGGKGLRMGTDIPKQFLPLDGVPVLMRTIKAFKEYDSEIQIILVLPVNQQEYWKNLCEKYSLEVQVMLADGGETRFHSVKNGLSLIPDNAKGIVGVHDGVRPFPSVETICRVYDAAREKGAAVPVVPVVDTLRHLSDELHSETVPRSEYRIVQTPQAFDIHLLKSAYTQQYSSAFTDDASVVEHTGHDVALVEGNGENIKITRPFDMLVADAIIHKK